MLSHPKGARHRRKENYFLISKENIKRVIKHKVAVGLLDSAATFYLATNKIILLPY